MTVKVHIYVAILTITVFSHAITWQLQVYLQSLGLLVTLYVPPQVVKRIISYGNKAKHRDFPKPVGSDTNTSLPSTKALTASFCSIFNDS